MWIGPYQEGGRVGLEPCTRHLKVSQTTVSPVMEKTHFFWPRIFLRGLCQIMNNALPKRAIVQSV